MPSIIFGKSMVVAGLLAISAAASAHDTEPMTGRWQLASVPLTSTLHAIDVTRKDGQWTVTEVTSDKTCGKIFARIEAQEKADPDGHARLSGRVTDDNGHPRRVYLTQENSDLLLMVEGDHSIAMRSIPFLTRRYVRTGPSQCTTPIS